MQIESHATPPSSSPQLRYAALHRAIERGLASDEVWRELAEVCVLLGHRDESAHSVKQIENATLRNAMVSRLERLGVRGEMKFEVRGPSTAPAASDVGHGGHHGETVAGSTREHLGDALQYLLLQRMPLLALVTTLSFPVLVGLGGFLTAGRSFLLLAGIAALPGLMVLSLVGAMGRRILRCSFEGSNDVPAVGDLGKLFDDAQRFLADAALVLGAFLAPPLVALLLGAPLDMTLPGLVIGGLFAPMAWALRNLRGDLQSLSPVLLTRALARCPLQYAGVALCCWLLFAPAALTTWLVLDRPVWVQIAMVGPLTVLPFFIASRFLGTWFETRRKVFGAFLRAPFGTKAANAQEKAPAAPTPSPAPAARPQPAAKRPAPTARTAPAPKLPPRPDQLRYYEAKNVHESRTAPAPRTTRRREAPAPQQTQQQSQPQPQQPAQPEAQRRQIEGRSPRRGLGDQPDLSHMPGALVVKGKDRARQGAAARPN